MVRTPGELADALAALPVLVSSIDVRAGQVAADDYPGGARPTSVVCVSGAGHRGLGEHVGFTAADHVRFAAGAPTLLEEMRARARGGAAGAPVDALVPPGLPPYERAALEAALIDLAMRQADLTLASLMGIDRVARVRVVVSFATTADPVGHIRRLRASGYTGALKVDVDPSWDQATRAALAKERAIAILDFKGRGDRALGDHWAALLPHALLEDPPEGTASERVARDAPLADARAVAAALARGEAVNLKAPRMGGPLEVLRSLELVARSRDGGHGRGGAPVASHGRTNVVADVVVDVVADVLAYLGGMFEVGPGRVQARQLAALFCADAPNDLAPVIGTLSQRFGARPSPPAAGSVHQHDAEPLDGGRDQAPAVQGSWSLPVRLDTPGFGGGE